MTEASFAALSYSSYVHVAALKVGGGKHKKTCVFFRKLLWVGILQEYLPKYLGHFGEKTPLNQPNRILAFLEEKSGTFSSVCIICRILPSIYTNMIQSKKTPL